MKTRKSFVSNSSSSSFIAVGIECDEEKFVEILENYNSTIQLLSGLTNNEDKGIAIIISEWEDYESDITPINTIIEAEEKLQKIIGTNKHATIYSGTRYN